jgi:hypothetical protein
MKKTMCALAFIALAALLYGQNTGDFEINGTVLAKYRGTAAVVAIPAGVVSIGDWAFSENSSLTSITIPAGVTAIGNWAFYRCDSLTGITIPPSVTKAGEGAFFNCPFPPAMKEGLVKRFGEHVFYEDRGR